MNDVSPSGCGVTRPVSTAGAPPAIGPYAQAIIAGGLVFTSGQIPLDPGTGAMVEGGIGPQTRRVLDNLRAVLEAAGSSLELVVKSTVFLADLGDYAEVNRIWGEYFASHPPARSAVQVAGLPRGSLIEVELVAAVSPR